MKLCSKMVNEMFEYYKAKDKQDFGCLIVSLIDSIDSYVEFTILERRELLVDYLSKQIEMAHSLMDLYLELILDNKMIELMEERTKKRGDVPEDISVRLIRKFNTQLRFID
jgi:hypothetical protein